MTTPLKEHYLAEMTRFQNGAAAEAVTHIRSRGKSAFQQMDFPGTKDEAWRQTNIKPILAHPFFLTGETQTDDAEIKKQLALLPIGPDDYFLVTVNGRFSLRHSRLPSVSHGYLGGLKEAVAEHMGATFTDLLQRSAYPAHAFLALNDAFLSDGTAILLEENVKLDHTLHIVCLTGAAEDASAIHERCLIRLKQGARACIAVHHAAIGHAPTVLHTFVEEYVLDRDSALIRLESLQDRADDYRISRLTVKQKENSRLKSFSFALDPGKITRNEIQVELQEAGCTSKLYGMALNTEKKLLDNDLLIHHRAPSCTSRMRYKQMLNGSSRGVFTGKIHVDKDAQHTNSEQLSANILLSGQARMDAKPQLEIYADDVRCTHGVTVGRPDPLALFYLRSRGIDSPLGTKMLSFGFAEDVISRVPDESLKNWFSAEFWKRIQRET